MSSFATLVALLLSLSPRVAAKADSLQPDIDWASHGLDSREQRFSELSQISARRVSFDAKLGIIAPPITYALGGRHYISLLVGYGSGGGGGIGGAMGWKYGHQPRRLLSFALDGKAVLPATPPADFSLTALDDPAIRLDPLQIDKGNALYFKTCQVCHGGSAVATGDAPDLRESAIALDRKSFAAVLRDGTRTAGGMPRFEDFSEDEIESVYQAIRAHAREALSSGK